MCLDCHLDKGRSGKAFILGHSLETLGKPFQSLKQSQGIQEVWKSLGMRRLFAYHTGKKVSQHHTYHRFSMHMFGLGRPLMKLDVMNSGHCPFPSTV